MWEAPEALPSEGRSAAEIACAPTGVVCCADDMLTLFQLGFDHARVSGVVTQRSTT
jgi:hypothetical protein